MDSPGVERYSLALADSGDARIRRVG